MLNFNEYFRDEYQFTLKELSYNLIENDASVQQFDLQISDTITTEIIDRQLHVTFGRKVFFEPAVLYRMNVVFSINIRFKDEVDIESAAGIDWNDALARIENPYFINVVSRASNLIAVITSSYGQQPLITPPSPIIEK